MKDEGLAPILLVVAAAVAGGGGFAFREYIADNGQPQSRASLEQARPSESPPASRSESPPDPVPATAPEARASVTATAAAVTVRAPEPAPERSVGDDAPVPLPEAPPRTDPETVPETVVRPVAETESAVVSPEVSAVVAEPDDAPDDAVPATAGDESDEAAPQPTAGESRSTPAGDPATVASLLQTKVAAEPQPAAETEPQPIADAETQAVAVARPQAAAETFSDAAAPTKRGQTFATARGLLPYPAGGRGVGLFGSDAGGGLTSKGITIAAAGGAPVVAPYDGHIAFAGPFRGYGRVLIIDHDDGYHSLLAGLGDSDGVVGQWVLAGEPIGSIVPAADADPTLYVEFWHDGEPMNPLPWLAPKQTRVADAAAANRPAQTATEGEAGSLARLERLAAALDAERSRIFRSLPRTGDVQDPTPAERVPDVMATAEPKVAPPIATPEPAEPKDVEDADAKAVHEPEGDKKSVEPEVTVPDPSEPEAPHEEETVAAPPSPGTDDAGAAGKPERDAEPDEPDVASSDPDQPRDAEPRSHPAAETQTAPLAPADEEAVAAAVPTYRIHVAAMRSAEAAEAEWRRLLVRNGDILGPLETSVTPVDLGEKSTFYRIRAGRVGDRTAARSVCAALAVRRVACLVVAPGD